MLTHKMDIYCNKCLELTVKLLQQAQIGTAYEQTSVNSHYMKDGAKKERKTYNTREMLSKRAKLEKMTIRNYKP